MSTTQSPKELDPNRLKNSMIPLIILLIIGSVVGVTLGGFISMTYVGATASFWTVSHQMAAVSVGITFALFLVPLWGLLAGTIFASEATSSIRNRLDVKLVPDNHPIAIRAQELAASLDLPPINYIGYYKGEEINAFAAGIDRRNAMIAFSDGAIGKLNKDEFEAVMAHEIGHIANNDMARMTYARSFQSSLTWFLMFKKLKNLARWMFTFVSEIGIMALSRSREYRADAIAAALIHPDAMISALKAIEQDQVMPPSNQKLFSNFMFRANPAGLFDTHPTLEKRIHAIETERYIKELPFTIPDSQSNEIPTATEPLAPEAFYG